MKARLVGRIGKAKFLVGLSGMLLVSAMAAPAISETPAAPTPAATERDGLVFERQQTMTHLKDDAELLGKIVAGDAPEDKLAETTKAIAKGAHDALDDFRKKVPGGRAKPEVWTQYADFTQRMESFARNADAMAKVGESGDVAGVTALMVDAVPCKQCHDLYREPKKE